MEQIGQKTAQRRKHPVNVLKSDTVKWLSEEHNIDLLNENVQEMAAFLILWPMVEATFFSCGVNVSTEIRDKSPKIEAGHKTILEEIKTWYGTDALSYIRKLHIKESSIAAQTVKSYLGNEDISLDNERRFVFFVIYKYRCRLFHGEKEFDRVASKQVIKIKSFNQFLMACLNKSTR